MEKCCITKEKHVNDKELQEFKQSEKPTSNVSNNSFNNLPFSNRYDILNNKNDAGVKAISEREVKKTRQNTRTTLLLQDR